jgi:D-aminoacyl-tRNA deacylase
VYVLVVSLGDPVSRMFLEVAPEMPLVETRGGLEIRKFRDVPVVVHRGDSTEFSNEEVLASLGRHAIFISRHEMANPRPLFTVHTPGGWPDVSVAHPHLASSLYRSLCRNAYEPFGCAFEATHHPPNTSAVSATFIEVGSTEREWRDRKAVETLVHVVEEVTGRELERRTPAMVVGDLHYVTVADMVLRGDVDIGHVVPKYVEIKLEVVQTAFRKHVAPVEKVFLFRKNVKNPARAEIVEFFRSSGVEVVLKG